MKRVPGAQSQRRPHRRECSHAVKAARAAPIFFFNNYKKTFLTVKEGSAAPIFFNYKINICLHM